MARAATDVKIGPTPEQLAKHGYERVNPAEIDSKEQPIGETVRNVTQTPLDRYYARKAITDRQWNAGDRFRTAFYLSGLEPSVIGSYTDAGCGLGPSFQIPATEQQAMHRERYRRAVEAVGKRLAAVLVDVACLEKSAGEFGCTIGRTGTRADVAGMTALALALDSLADHYGLA